MGFTIKVSFYNYNTIPRICEQNQGGAPGTGGIVTYEQRMEVSESYLTVNVSTKNGFT